MAQVHDVAVDEQLVTAGRLRDAVVVRRRGAELDELLTEQRRLPQHRDAVGGKVEPVLHLAGDTSAWKSSVSSIPLTRSDAHVGDLHGVVDDEVADVVEGRR